MVEEGEERLKNLKNAISMAWICIAAGKSGDGYEMEGR